MRKYPNILFLSISLLFLLGGCMMSRYNSGGRIDISGPEYQELRPFGPAFEKVLYKADFMLNNKHFHGLMMIKRFSDQSVKVAFFNEPGLNFFDFELRENAARNKMALKLNHIYSALDRKMLIKSIEKYFSMLLGPGLNEGTYKTYIRADGDHVLLRLDTYRGKDAYISKNLIEPYSKIINISPLSGRERILITISEKKANHAPEHIIIEQPGIRLRIDLQQARTSP